jgi:hypothetical protein
MRLFAVSATTTPPARSRLLVPMARTIENFPTWWPLPRAEAVERDRVEDVHAAVQVVGDVQPVRRPAVDGDVVRRVELAGTGALDADDVRAQHRRRVEDDDPVVLVVRDVDALAARVRRDALGPLQLEPDVEARRADGLQRRPVEDDLGDAAVAAVGDVHGDRGGRAGLEDREAAGSDAVVHAPRAREQVEEGAVAERREELTGLRRVDLHPVVVGVEHVDVAGAVDAHAADDVQAAGLDPRGERAEGEERRAGLRELLDLAAVLVADEDAAVVRVDADGLGEPEHPGPVRRLADDRGGERGSRRRRRRRAGEREGRDERGQRREEPLVSLDHLDP